MSSWKRISLVLVLAGAIMFSLGGCMWQQYFDDIASEYNPSKPTVVLTVAGQLGPLVRVDKGNVIIDTSNSFSDDINPITGRTVRVHDMSGNKVKEFINATQSVFTVNLSPGTYNVTVILMTALGASNCNDCPPMTIEVEDPIICSDPTTTIRLNGTLLRDSQTPEVDSGMMTVEINSRDNDPCYTCGGESFTDGIVDAVTVIEEDGVIIVDPTSEREVKFLGKAGSLYRITSTITDDDCPSRIIVEERTFRVENDPDPEPVCKPNGPSDFYITINGVRFLPGDKVPVGSTIEVGIHVVRGNEGYPENAVRLRAYADLPDGTSQSFDDHPANAAPDDDPTLIESDHIISIDVGNTEGVMSLQTLFFYYDCEEDCNKMEDEIYSIQIVSST
jgi:hypothetical protein